MDNLRELQLVELNILKETLRLFEKHHISYFALGGTMLGAVRHQGFIPWDDDIDIGVPREDFEHLREISRELPERFKFCTFYDDPEYPYYFARFEDEAMLVRSTRAEDDELTPAWIDVFPLDGMPDNGFFRKIHGMAILVARMIFQISRYSSIVNVKRDNRPLYEKAIIWCTKVFRLERVFGNAWSFFLLDKTLKRCLYQGSGYNINAMGAYKLREMFDKRVFGNGRMYSFEDIQICGPQDYETYLTQLYGDWRTPADFSHHSVTEITRREDCREPEEERKQI